MMTEMQEEKDYTEHLKRVKVRIEEIITINTNGEKSKGQHFYWRVCKRVTQICKGLAF